MKAQFCALLFFAFLVTPVVSHAAKSSHIVSGEYLLKLQKAFNNFERATGQDRETYNIQTAYYLGFIAGVADASDHVCIPADGSVDVNQLAHIVSNWLDRNPQSSNGNAVSLVQAALTKAFPCK